MSLIQHSLFPRTMLNMDEWVKRPQNTLSSTLEEFDAFDELDRLIGRNLTWINQPSSPSLPSLPNVPQKYRITVDCNGFKHSSIKTDLTEDKTRLVVTGKEEYKETEDDWCNKEFKRTYQLPANCQADKMISFMVCADQLVIEFPLKETQTEPNADLMPKVTENKDGTKLMSLRFNVPFDIDPSQIIVTIKDRDLILRYEDKRTKDDAISKYHYYQVCL
jgi:HSP20 family molecular chaperone IbpA